MRGIQVTIVVEEIGDGDKTVRNGILSNRWSFSHRNWFIM
jgi:hypothetical protein